MNEYRLKLEILQIFADAQRVVSDHETSLWLAAWSTWRYAEKQKSARKNLAYANRLKVDPELKAKRNETARLSAQKSALNKAIKMLNDGYRPKGWGKVWRLAAGMLGIAIEEKSGRSAYYRNRAARLKELT